MNNNSTEIKKQEFVKEIRTHRTLPKIHTLSNREMNELAGGKGKPINTVVILPSTANTCR